MNHHFLSGISKQLLTFYLGEAFLGTFYLPVLSLSALFPPCGTERCGHYLLGQMKSGRASLYIKRLSDAKLYWVNTAHHTQGSLSWKHQGLPCINQRFPMSQYLKRSRMVPRIKPHRAVSLCVFVQVNVHVYGWMHTHVYRWMSTCSGE